MPSRGSGEATAVARTTVSPVVTSAAPEACFAMRPVSKTSRLPPASSTAYFMLRRHRCPRFILFAWETCGGKCAAGVEVRAAGPSPARNKQSRARHERIGSGKRVGPRSSDSSAQALAACSIRQVHYGPRIWGNGGLDQYPVWALPVQCGFLITCGYRACRLRRDSDRNHASSGNPAGGGAC